MLDFEDDDMGLLDAEPWDHHDLDKIVEEEKNYD